MCIRISAVDETVIRIDGQQFWLYAAVNPNSNEFLHIHLFPTTTTALTEQFLQELREKHDIEDVVLLVDHAQHLKTALQRVGCRFQTVQIFIVPRVSDRVGDPGRRRRQGSPLTRPLSSLTVSGPQKTLN